MVPKIIWSPFLYVLDLIKDVIQLSLFLYAVGGPKYAITNWSSFSSVVSFYIPRLVQTGDFFQSCYIHIKKEFHLQLSSIKLHEDLLYFQISLTSKNL